MEGNSKGLEVGSARVSPTKDFFVRMLTRDIEMEDAILDLLDNCLDGILRSKHPDPESSKPYTGYRATITVSKSEFKIEDNCGGIPIETAENYAFAMGRPAGAGDDTPATIGMYGIGMKRAIFKLGTEAVVESRYGKESGFYVEFTSEWMHTDDWTNLAVYELKKDEFPEPGTRITVLELGKEASRYFSSPEKVDEFRKRVSRHYSLILAKGFEVTVGSPDEVATGAGSIQSEPFRLLDSIRPGSAQQGIRPYIYQGTVGDVRVEIYAGLYRPVLSQEELADEEKARGSSDEAGWTVACNDRVVIWKDKTRLTGWGEASVPNYHGQFIPITGIVLLHSDDPSLLPLTTTKRGIDGSSSVYSEVKDLMRRATKALTGFTNRWKQFPDARDAIYEKGSLVDLPELRRIVRDEEVPLKTLRGARAFSAFQPKLPEPPRERTHSRISYLAAKTDISTLGEHFFGDPSARSQDVGVRSFELALEAATEATE